MRDLTVMYHYIRNRDWKGIHPLTPEDFSIQLDWLCKNYEIVQPSALAGPKKNKPFCVISFDDGTKDQYSIAFDILNRRGIPAYFTIMSGPLVEKIIPIFHLTHTVLSFFSDIEIWEELTQKYDLSDVPQKSEIYHYESDVFRRYNKYVFNFMLSEKESRAYLEPKALSLFKSKDDFINQFYVSTEEWRKMRQAGMTLGVHCVRHLPYSGDALDFYSNEIEPCSQFIKDNINTAPEWYTPAFGGGEKAKQMMMELEPILKANGYKAGFSTAPGLNNGLSQFWLNRYDCTQLPPRKPLNEVVLS
jgi:hypothetical protein